MKIKKLNVQKKCVKKREYYKNRLEAAQIENKIIHLEKIKLMQIVLKKIKKS